MANCLAMAKSIMQNKYMLRWYIKAYSLPTRADLRTHSCFTRGKRLRVRAVLRTEIGPEWVGSNVYMIQYYFDKEGRYKRGLVMRNKSCGQCCTLYYRPVHLLLINKWWLPIRSYQQKSMIYLITSIHCTCQATELTIGSAPFSTSGKSNLGLELVTVFNSL
jgi:hypothetical protein